MTHDRELLPSLVADCVDFFDWVAQTLADPAAKAALTRDLGGTVSSERPLAFDDDRVASLRAYRDATDPDLEAALLTLNDVRLLLDALSDFVSAIDTGGMATADELVQTALDLLATDFIRLRHPKLYFVMQFASFTFDATSQLGEGGSSLERSLSSVTRLFQLVLMGGSWPGWQLASDNDALRWSFPTLRLLAGLLAFAHKFGSLGRLFKDDAGRPRLQVLYGWDSVPGIDRTLADQVADRMLSVKLWDQANNEANDPASQQAERAATVSVALVPRSHGGPGAFVALGGEMANDIALSKRWTLAWRLDAAAGLALLAGGPKGLQVAGPASGQADLGANVSLVSVPPEGRAVSFAIPHASGTRLEIGRVALTGRLGPAGMDLRAALHDCRLVIDSALLDSFLASLLPRDNTELAFSFGTGYTSANGFFTSGGLPLLSGHGDAPKVLSGRDGPAPTSAPTAPPEPPLLPVLATGAQPAGLLIAVPVGKGLGGVRVERILISVLPNSGPDGGTAELRVALCVSATLGPVLAKVDQIGLRWRASRPNDRRQANLHFTHLAMGFLPPAGVAVAVDATAVTGGGFLFYDDAKKLYAGVLELQINKILAVKAVGLLSTRLPGGAAGYSLLLLITAEGFKPQPLGMGFWLTGVGGLLAIHRSVNETALRDGLKSGVLTSVLFPRDPVRNADTLLTQLDTVFPARHGSHVFGPVVRIAWGVPLMLLMDLALLLEIGHRHRLVVMGRVRAALPRMEDELVRLTMDALGIIDFDDGTVSLDAVLVDSRFLDRFPLTGQMALRLRWSSPRSFALAVGGMHRAFTPPSQFPTLERIALSLTTGDNPRLHCDAYFAVTANTVQFGAHAHLYAAAYGFSVQGDIGFDVLIQRDPFHFLAEYEASLQLKKGSRSLFKVQVEGALEGPRPLNLRVKATFEVLWWDVTIRINRSLFEGARPAPAPAVSAIDTLRAALADPRQWVTELPAGQSHIVSLRARGRDDVVRAHPLGSLSIRQSVVPLNLSRDIDRLGDCQVTGPRRFTLTGVTLNQVPADSAVLAAVREDFAPAQYFDMSDALKLSSPSYQAMDAGMRIAPLAPTLGYSEGLASPLIYATRTLGRSNAAQPAATSAAMKAAGQAGDYVLSDAQLQAQAWHGSAGRSERRRAAPVPAHAAAASPWRLQEPGWVLANADTLQALPDASGSVGVLAKTTLSHVEAIALAQAHPHAQLVRPFELAP